MQQIQRVKALDGPEVEVRPWKRPCTGEALPALGGDAPIVAYTSQVVERYNAFESRDGLVEAISFADYMGDGQKMLLLATAAIHRCAARIGLPSRHAAAATT